VSRYRRTSIKSKWYLDDELYDTVFHYARNYPTWKAECEVYESAIAIRYDKERVQTSGDYDPTETMAIRHASLSLKLSLIEQALEIAAPEESIRQFLRLGVCYGLTWYQLQRKRMPCGRNAYSAMRGRFYYELAQKI